ncbi:trehalose-6-phosphate synthase [candidate division WOR-1 bacterium RIFOXYB2_FULL_42_35]|uniref:Trehalose-6-phosphate synthase n=1 Tax=candidate division WOR-1 bacterium RIFOXYC2_FULL_41_25 TaxID=1802586 RepID=A0A1F4TR23_UNCSA|nr:MAG: trehalose-6-phosphate synthase [candidate division WOR-1 bacterium RIFOXYA2_FULL_41_14]OGC25739.1 MAG: trehalose-6-phosphate synthase [candidate division WOR-1 bacterium RIFOXYB2_FULL_42_35]OGC35141.1 MAG: trehalose-6-phosphate synthase [candidate division WOR-1 bacterium RIFOXYC2_FULL_41_25]
MAVSNREPYIHKVSGDKIKFFQPASGVVTALDPVLQACHGLWVAHGSGDADRKVVDDKSRIQVPPNDPQYTLKRVWLTKAEETGYYYGFANEALWPLCHIVYTKPKFSESDWNYYKLVNERFAKAILEEIGDQETLLFIQDYHFMLLPKLIKDANPKAKIALFWHIPWPNPEVFRICPWKKELLEGLLGADLLGFHLRYHVDNFLETINHNLEAKVDKVASSVTYKGMETLVRPYPISIDFEKIAKEAASKATQDDIKKVKEDLGITCELIGVGTDRIDYTKGIIEKFTAIDRFLEKYPEYQGRFVYIQIGSLSRIHLDTYKKLNDDINSLVERINWKYSSDHWSPIILIRKYFTPQELLAIYRMANICLVTSLHDGMNLVAKEFIAACSKDKSMLVLSQFAGAARELTDAVTFNPYNPEECADAIRTALTMPAEEREQRVERMKAVVKENNIYNWAAKIIQALLRLS